MVKEQTAAREWCDVTLGDLIDVRHGFAFKGKYIHDEPQGNRLLTPGNFAIGGGFKRDKFKYYDGPFEEDYILQEGDLLVTMTDLSKQSDTLGYPAVVPACTDGGRYLHNQRLGKVVPRESAVLHTGFLYYLMCSTKYRHEVLASATGTTVKHTSPDRIGQFKFSLPPIAQQRAIAHVLGTLDEKIELNRRMNETLEEMSRALFKSWFVDFDPVRTKLEGRWRRGESLPGLPAALYDLFPGRLVDSEIGEIPEGWEVKPLELIATFLNGLAMQKFPDNGGPILPVIKIAQLRAGNTLRADSARASIPSKFIIRDGDVLFSWSGSLELSIWAGGDGALNQHLFKVSSELYPQWFFYYWVGEHLEDFRYIAADKATTMGHITRRHLSEALTTVPDSSLLDSMSYQIQPLLDRSLALRLESRALASLREALLPRLVSGNLQIESGRCTRGQ